MSSVGLLPAMAWVLSSGRGPERRRVAIIGLAVLGHLLLAEVVVGESLAGIEPLTPTQAPLGASFWRQVGAVLAR